LSKSDDLGCLVKGGARKDESMAGKKRCTRNCRVCW